MDLSDSGHVSVELRHVLLFLSGKGEYIGDVDFAIGKELFLADVALLDDVQGVGWQGLELEVQLGAFLLLFDHLHVGLGHRLGVGLAPAGLDLLGEGAPKEVVGQSQHCYIKIDKVVR